MRRSSDILWQEIQQLLHNFTEAPAGHIVSIPNVIWHSMYINRFWFSLFLDLIKPTINKYSSGKKTLQFPFQWIIISACMFSIPMSVEFQHKHTIYLFLYIHTHTNVNRHYAPLTRCQQMSLFWVYETLRTHSWGNCLKVVHDFMKFHFHHHYNPEHSKEWEIFSKPIKNQAGGKWSE